MASITSPHAHGNITHVDSGGNRLYWDKSGDVDSDLIGRIAFISTGAARGQIRQVTGVGEDSTDYYLDFDYPWDVSAFPGVTDVRPSVGHRINISTRFSGDGGYAASHVDSIGHYSDEERVTIAEDLFLHSHVVVHMDSTAVVVAGNRIKLYENSCLVVGRLKYDSDRGIWYPEKSCTWTDTLSLIHIPEPTRPY